MVVGVDRVHGIGKKDAGIAWSDVVRRVDAENELYVITIQKDGQELTDAVVNERSVLRAVQN